MYFTLQPTKFLFCIPDVINFVPVGVVLEYTDTICCFICLDILKYRSITWYLMYLLKCVSIINTCTCYFHDCDVVFNIEVPIFVRIYYCICYYKTIEAFLKALAPCLFKYCFVDWIVQIVMCILLCVVCWHLLLLNHLLLSILV